MRQAEEVCQGVCGSKAQLHMHGLLQLLRDCCLALQLADVSGIVLPLPTGLHVLHCGMRTVQSPTLM
jgi:hypothetical protein